MKLLAATVASLVLLSSTSTQANQASAPSPPGAPAASAADSAHAVVIQRAGSQPSARGPETNFTGSVRVDGRFEASSPARVGGATVTFERPHGLAHAPARSDPDCYCWGRPGPALGRASSGDPAGRRGLDPTWREALARGHADIGHDPHRHLRTARRQGRGLDGEGQR
jgi:hypothetical protein